MWLTVSTCAFISHISQVSVPAKANVLSHLYIYYLVYNIPNAVPFAGNAFMILFETQNVWTSPFNTRKLLLLSHDAIFINIFHSLGPIQWDNIPKCCDRRSIASTYDRFSMRRLVTVWYRMTDILDFTDFCRWTD